MPKFSNRSKDKLRECHIEIRKVFMEAIKHFDFTVVWGFRGQLDQDGAYYAGNSRVKFPDSKHNVLPSMAIDIAPYPIDWGDEKRFIFLAGFVLATAAQMGVTLRWGGDWDSDTQVRDNKFNDYGHFELMEP